ncbi:MAG TPA: colicin transporter [Sphingobium sp.]
MIAVKRLQSVLWVMLVTLGALSAYLVSLRVGAEQNELARVRAQIASTKSDMRYLETEFGARSSLRQLERWNQDDFRYSAPTAQQYLNGERALAKLDGVEPNGPVYVAPPVMVAMADTPADLAASKPAAPASPAPAQIRTEAATRAPEISVIRSAQAADSVEKLKAPKAKLKLVLDNPDKVTPVARNAARVAMLDAKLLDDGTLGDLSARAARERKKGGH